MNSNGLLQATKVTKEWLGSKTIKTFELPQGIYGIHYVDGLFYAERTRYFQDSKKRGFSVVSSTDGEHWEDLARMDDQPTASGSHLSNARFLRDDTFLVSAMGQPFSCGDGVSLLGVARIRNGVLRFEKSLDMDLPKKLPARSGAAATIFGSTPTLVFHRVGDAWVAMHHRTGAYWVITLSDSGQPRVRARRLFDEVNPWNAQARYEYAVLACQPDGEGGALMATRTLEGILHGLTPEPGSTVSTLPPGVRVPMEVIEAKYRSEVASSLRRYPGLVWWRFDGPSQSFKQCVAPEGAPTRLETPEDYSGFTFRFDAQRKLVIETRLPKPAAPVKVLEVGKAKQPPAS